MATTENRLSKVVGSDGKSQIIVKLSISRTERPCFKSGIFINPEFFKPVKSTARGSIYDVAVPKKGKLNFLDIKEASEAKTKLDVYINKLLKICQVTEEKNKEVLNKEWVERALDIINKKHITPENITFNLINDLLEKEKEEQTAKSVKKRKKNFFTLFDEYIETNDKAAVSVRNFMVLKRVLGRFERFKQLTDKKTFKLDVDTITADTIEDFRDYFRNESALQKEYPAIFEKLLTENPATTDTRKKGKILERGHNTTVLILKKFQSFFTWLNKKKKTSNRPFEDVEIGTEVYGNVIYITLEERNLIADFDLSENKRLEEQRDIYIFQCLIGCRVGDLLRLTPQSVIGGAIEYIANKTKKEKPMIVRVPLNERAKAILEKYKGGERLLPFISEQKYNDAIKEIFVACGVTRIVTKLDSLTGEEVKVPIYEIASSHMARRTFVGNLYKQVKDPNLVGSLSGHKEGSKAFARYRDIDEDMKKELVDLIK
ncbi:MAG: site-specific integrase [Phocaeicola sp.]